MIKINVTDTGTTVTIEITGHATYGDAPAGDNLTYKKVCACVTLVSLSIQDECGKNDIPCTIKAGYLKVVIPSEKFTETLRAYVHELFILHNVTSHTYTLVNVN